MQKHLHSCLPKSRICNYRLQQAADVFYYTLIHEKSVEPLIERLNKETSVSTRKSLILALSSLVTNGLGMNIIIPLLEKIAEDENEDYRVKEEAKRGIPVAKRKIIETGKRLKIERVKFIEEQNKSFTDSLNYAKLVQEATLPSEEIWYRNLQDSFILFKPKEIVSGDFYWMEIVGNDNSPTDQSLTLFAVADCTGHGVPGALTSMICSNALSRAVQEFHLTDPGRILDKVAELVLETFKNKIREGMDISICCLNKENLEMRFAGAYLNVYLVQNNNLHEFKTTRQLVGGFENQFPFESFKVQLQKGNSIYLLTDGFADQFGGPNGKKFYNKRLQQLLFTNSHLPLKEQKEILENIFNEWKGNEYQVDDILIIGVRL